MSSERLYQILRAPRLSEKTARLQERSNQYVFEIAPDATKAEVKAAVEKIFGVEVLKVNVVNLRGKRKTFRFRPGERSGMRKAYVRLREGQTIDVTAQRA